MWVQTPLRVQDSAQSFLGGAEGVKEKNNAALQDSGTSRGVSEGSWDGGKEELCPPSPPPGQVSSLSLQGQCWLTRCLDGLGLSKIT